MVYFVSRFWLQFSSNKSSQSGQIGIIILLIMVILLTIGISIASQTSQDLFLSQQQTDSSRVFNAAEAGIEQALSGDFDFEGSSFEGSLSGFAGTDVDVGYTIHKVNVLETRLFELSGVKIDVEGAVSGNTLDIRWSQQSDCASQDVASIAIASYIQDANGYRVEHDAFAGCDRGDGFTPASQISSDGYHRRVIFTIPDDSLFIHLKPVYADTHVFVAGGNWTLPVQGFTIRSQAESNVGNEFRAVEVNRTLDSPPSIMDYTVFSGNTIIKQE